MIGDSLRRTDILLIKQVLISMINNLAVRFKYNGRLEYLPIEVDHSFNIEFKWTSSKIN